MNAFEPCATLHWTEQGAMQHAAWPVAWRGMPAPRQTHIVDDTLSANQAYGLTGQGHALLWRGDFYQARQILHALGRRADQVARALPAWQADAPADQRAQRFHRERQARGHRARILNLLLVPVAADYAIPMRRAPDWRAACLHAWGAEHPAGWVPLRELLGVVSAYEWHQRGVAVPALNGARIHPDYGVFAPTRMDYLTALTHIPLPAACANDSSAMDLGTGTGVLAALLAHRGLRTIWATDTQPRAVQCARHNLQRLHLSGQVTVLEQSLFAPGRVALVVCNPPWLPGRPCSPLEHGVFDPNEQMLRGFVQQLQHHLVPGGEGWLVMSDLAERLGLRAPQAWQNTLAAHGLRLVGRYDTPANHPRSANPTDALHAARAAEIITVWRLALA